MLYKLIAHRIVHSLLRGVFSKSGIEIVITELPGYIDVPGT